MSDKIEPTKEQCEAVKAWCTMDLGVRYGWRRIASFLAEREHRLREELRAQHRKEIADFNETCARLVDRAASGFTEYAHGDDVLRPAIQKVIDLRMGVWGAQYANVNKLRADFDAARARIAELESSDAHLRKLLAEERGNVARKKDETR